MVNGDIGAAVVGLLLAYPLYALLGVGLGALLLSQPVAVVLPLLWTALLERLLVPGGPVRLVAQRCHRRPRARR
jgi:hypothetical protein